MPAWFLALALVGIFSGSVLTYGQALDAEERHRAPRRLAKRGQGHAAPTRLRDYARASLTPVAAPGSVSPRPPPAKLASVKTATAPDPRLQGILVGMGFRAPEAKDAISKLPSSAAASPLGDQVKAALALLSK